MSLLAKDHPKDCQCHWCVLPEVVRRINKLNKILGKAVKEINKHNRKRRKS